MFQTLAPAIPIRPPATPERPVIVAGLMRQHGLGPEWADAAVASLPGLGLTPQAIRSAWAGLSPRAS